MPEHGITDVAQQAAEQGQWWVIIIVAVMLVVYFFIQRYYDYNKHKNELVVGKELMDTLSNILSSIKDVSNSMSTISSFLTHFTDSIISKDREKCRIGIRLAFNNLKRELILFARDIIVANDVDKKKEYIDGAIEKIINSQYYDLYNSLSVYEINNRKVNNIIKEDWKAELFDTLKKLIYDTSLDKVDRIDLIITKLDAQIDDYTTYTHNKTFNE